MAFQRINTKGNTAAKSPTLQELASSSFVFLISLSAAFLGSALPNDVADSDEGPDEDSDP